MKKTFIVELVIDDYANKDVTEENLVDAIDELDFAGSISVELINVA